MTTKLTKDEIRWAREHLAKWCRGQSRGDDAAVALLDRIASFLDREGWDYGWNHGWPSTLERVQEYEAYNRDLADRMRSKPFRVATHGALSEYRREYRDGGAR